MVRYLRLPYLILTARILPLPCSVYNLRHHVSPRQSAIQMEKEGDRFIETLLYGIRAHSLVHGPSMVSDICWAHLQNR